MKNNILEILRIDPGQRTLGELLQDRAAANYEIARLRSELERIHIEKSQVLQAERRTAEMVTKVETGSIRQKTLLRLSDVCELLSLSRSGIYRRVAEGTFPKPIKIGVRSVRWQVEAINAWLDSHEVKRREKLV